MFPFPSSPCDKENVCSCQEEFLLSVQVTRKLMCVNTQTAIKPRKRLFPSILDSSFSISQDKIKISEPKKEQVDTLKNDKSIESSYLEFSPNHLEISDNMPPKGSRVESNSSIANSNKSLQNSIHKKKEVSNSNKKIQMPCSCCRKEKRCWEENLRSWCHCCKIPISKKRNAEKNVKSCPNSPRIMDSIEVNSFYSLKPSKMVSQSQKQPLEEEKSSNKKLLTTIGPPNTNVGPLHKEIIVETKSVTLTKNLLNEDKNRNLSPLLQNTEHLNISNTSPTSTERNMLSLLGSNFFFLSDPHEISNLENKNNATNENAFTQKKSILVQNEVSEKNKVAIGELSPQKSGNDKGKKDLKILQDKLKSISFNDINSPITIKDQEEEILKLMKFPSEVIDISELSSCVSDEDLPSDKIIWKNKIGILSLKLKEKADLIEKLQSEIKCLKTATYSIKPKREISHENSLVSIIDEKDRIIQELTAELEKEEEHAQMTSKELEKVKAELIKKESLLELLNEKYQIELSTIKTNLEKQWQEEKQFLQEMIVKQKRENTELTSLVQISHAKLELYEDQVKEFREFVQQIDDFFAGKTASLSEKTTSEFMIATEEINTLQSLSNNLKQELTKASQEVVTLRQEQEIINFRLQESELSAQVLKTTINTQESALNQCYSRESILQKEVNNSLTTSKLEKERFDKSIEELQQNMALLQKDFLSAQLLITEQKNTISELHSKKQKMEQHLFKVEDDYQQLLENQASLLETKEFLNEENKSITETLKETEENLNLCKMELSRCQASYENEKKSVNTLKCQLDSLSDKYMLSQKDLMILQKQITSKNVNVMTEQISQNISMIEEYMKNLLDELLCYLNKNDSTLADKLNTDLAFLCNKTVKKDLSSDNPSFLTLIMKAIHGKTSDACNKSVSDKNETAFTTTNHDSRDFDEVVCNKTSCNIAQEELRNKTKKMISLFIIIIDTLKALQKCVVDKMEELENKNKSLDKDFHQAKCEVIKVTSEVIHSMQEWCKEKIDLNQEINQLKGELISKQNELDKVMESHKTLSDNYCSWMAQMSQNEEFVREVEEFHNYKRQLLLEKEEISQHLNEVMLKLEEIGNGISAPEVCITELLKSKLALKQEISRLKSSLFEKNSYLREVKEESKRQVEVLMESQNKIANKVTQMETLLEYISITLKNFLHAHENSELQEVLSRIENVYTVI